MIRVTEAIRKSGIGPDYDAVPKAFLEAKAQFGTTVHDLCSKATKEKVRLPDTEEGECAKRFIEWLWTAKADVLRSEVEVMGQVEGIPYAGRFDLEFKWNNEYYLADIKTTAQLYSHFGVQTAAYLHAAHPGEFRNWNRAVLWIRPESPARLVCDGPIIRHLDLSMWKSIIISQNWVNGARL